MKAASVGPDISIQYTVVNIEGFRGNADIASQLPVHSDKQRVAIHSVYLPFTTTHWPSHLFYKNLKIFIRGKAE